MRQPHELTPVERTTRPDRAVFFDAEARTNIEITPEEIDRALAGEKVWKPHFPYLVCAEYRDYERGSVDERDYFESSSSRAVGDSARDTGVDFIEKLWRDVEAFCPMGKKLHLFAHNAKYDTQVLAGVFYLVNLGYRVVSFSDDNPFIIRFEKYFRQSPRGVVYKKPKKKTILIVSSTNYYQQSLASLGKVFGIKKLDFDHGEEIAMENLEQREKAILYCRVDVRILSAAMTHLFEFIEHEDLGKFQLTIAGQAFQAFRSRFLAEGDIFIHSHEEALAVERRAYAGGRNECFYMGRVDVRIYVNDVNSMYPYTMMKYKYPVRHVSFRKTSSVETVEQLIRDGYLICCDALVDTPEPMFHLKQERLIFPTGRFWTSLSTPELIEAIKRGYLKAVKNVSVYEGKEIFAPYVDYMYKERLKAKKAKDSVRDLLFKMFLNTLYGKFGQKNEKWEAIDVTDPYDVELLQVWDPVERKMMTYKIFGGHVFQKQNDPDDIEATNSAPAIAAHVTANARMLLWRVFEAAGRENVFYCDTDSVFTNRAGYDRLQSSGWIDEKALGALAMEKQGFLYLNGCKDYVFFKSSPVKLEKPQRLAIHDARQLSEKLARTIHRRQLAKREAKAAGVYWYAPTRVTRGDHYVKQQKIKGVSRSAKMIAPDETGHLRFAVTQWTGFSERFKEGSFQNYRNKVIIKTLKREYKKAIVEGSTVIPFTLSLEDQQREAAKLELKAAARQQAAAKAIAAEVDPIMRICRSYGFIRVVKRGDPFFKAYMSLPQRARVKYFRSEGAPVEIWCEDNSLPLVDLIRILKESV